MLSAEFSSQDARKDIDEFVTTENDRTRCNTVIILMYELGFPKTYFS